MLASELARTLASAPCVVYFTKRDGTTRRMLTTPTEGGVTLRSGTVRVFDAEKGAWRSICAERVERVTPVRAREHRAPVEDRRPVATASTSSEWGSGYVGHRNRRTARA